jgi:hypothetical protein
MRVRNDTGTHISESRAPTDLPSEINRGVLGITRTMEHLHSAGSWARIHAMLFPAITLTKVCLWVSVASCGNTLGEIYVQEVNA